MLLNPPTRLPVSRVDISRNGKSEDSSHPDPLTNLLSCVGVTWDELYAGVVARCTRKLARFRCCDPEEAAHHTMLQILRVDFVDKYDPQRGSVLGLIYVIADRECLQLIRDWRRRLKKFSRLDIAGEIARSHSPLEQMILGEALDELRRERDLLPPKQREAFEYMKERAEGARKSDDDDVPPNYSAASRCRASLRSQLAKHDPRRTD